MAKIEEEITKSLTYLQSMKKLISISEEFLQLDNLPINYKNLTDDFLMITGAKYAIFNLFEENGKSFITKGVSGDKGIIRKAERLMGLNLEGYLWNEDKERTKKIANQTITRFPSLKSLVGKRMPDSIIEVMQKLFHVGEVIVIKIMRKNIMLGDFTLIMERGRSFTQDDLAELFTRQLGIAITQKRIEKKLIESETKLLAAQELANIGNWELDLTTNLLKASLETFRIYGIEYNESGISIEKAREKVRPEFHLKLDEEMINLISERKKYDIEFTLMDKVSGNDRYVHSLAFLVKDEQGMPLKAVGTIQDITKRKLYENEITFLNYHDHLTGLYNRRFFEEELSRLDTDRNLPLTIIMGDVNGLKLINDSFGHDAGDELLKKTADVIKKECRKDEIISRIGGDEFAILLPKVDAEKADEILSRISKSISLENVENINLSISFGYSVKKISSENVKDMFKDAENNMYRQKISEKHSVRSKTIDMIMNTLIEKNPKEMEHSQRVSEISEQFAIQLGLNKINCDQLKVAGLIHDIGKIGIEGSILNKPGKLSREEFSEIQKHCEIGYRILSSINGFSEIALTILEHHERWDGTGYPAGLKGEEISLNARIVSIADSYDAMTAERPYHLPMSLDDAMRELKRCAGTQFDPTLVNAFIKYLTELSTNT